MLNPLQDGETKLKDNIWRLYIRTKFYLNGTRKGKNVIKRYL